MNTITRDFAYIPVEFRRVWSRGVRTSKLTAFCFQWISLALLTDVYWKGSCRGLSSWTKTELSFPKSVQTIHTMQNNNHLSGVNLSLFKTRPGILKIESANMFISMQILIFHPMRNVNIFAYSQSFRRFRGLLIHSLVTVNYRKEKKIECAIKTRGIKLCSSLQQGISRWNEL